MVNKLSSWTIEPVTYCTIDCKLMPFMEWNFVYNIYSVWMYSHFEHQYVYLQEVFALVGSFQLLHTSVVFVFGLVLLYGIQCEANVRCIV